MQKTKYEKGFTLIELLIALTITGIILTSVVTLAFAMETANDTTDDTTQKQAQVRYATLRISELVRHSRLICSNSNNDLAVWRADENSDGQINIGELVYIDKGPSGNYLQFCEFPSSNSTAINLSSIQDFASNWWWAYCNDVNYTVLIPQCSNGSFSFDALPPESRFVSISFGLAENGVIRRYQINAALRGWAGNLLDGSGNIVSDDD